MTTLISPLTLSTQLIIRKVTQADLSVLEWEGQYAHYRRLYREIYQAMLEGKAVMWVADFMEVGIVGQVFVQYSSARRELADSKTRAYLYSFRVRPEYRGYGIGTRLLEAAEYDLVKRRFAIVTLNVGRDNIAGKNFYERHGYQVVAKEPGRWSYLDDDNIRHDVIEPAWRMEKHIV